MSSSLWRDARLGLRNFSRTPVLASVIVLSLALGVGGATTVFTFVDKILLEPLPVHDPDRLVALFGVTRDSDRFLQTSHPNYEDFRDRNDIFSGLLACQWIPLNLTEGEEPEQITGQIVSANYFEVLGVQPVLGRGFSPEEGRVPQPVIVLSHRLWTRRYEADPRIVGRPIRVNGRSMTVIGVAPEGFRGRGRVDPTEAWVPIAMHEAVFPYSEHVDDRDWGLFYLMGRLKPGVSRETAGAAMRTLAAQLEQEHPEANQGRSIAVLPITATAAVDPATTESYMRIARLFSAASGVLLLIACSNVANLLLVRARHRQGETALRLSLGATRRGLVRQMLAESTPLFVLAALAALPLAALGRAALMRVRPPYWAEASVDLGLDARIFLFALGISLLSALLFGLWPALRASGIAPAAALKASGGSGRGGGIGPSRILVVAQIALSLIALILAGLFVRSFWAAQGIAPGFAAPELMVLSFEPAALGLGPEPGLQLARRLEERVEGLPGVKSAAVSSNLLLSPVILRHRISLDEGTGALPAEESVLVPVAQVGPGYIETLGIGLLQGRAFTDADREGAPLVAVVNETMARHLWPDRPAVGRSFRLGETAADPQVEVVGVVADSRTRSLTETPEPYFYLPLLQHYSGTMNLYVRASGDPAALIGTVRSEVQAAAPGMPLTNVQTVEDLIEASLLTARTGYVVLSLFGISALALASLGTYGATADWVSRRRREIAIRMALGATRGQVVAMILREALIMVGAGLLLGLAAAWGLTRLVAGMLYGVSPSDPATYAVLALLVGALAMLSSLVPARRVAAVPPAVVLRQAF